MVDGHYYHKVVSPIGLLTIVAVQMNQLYPVIAAVIMLSVLVYETLGPVLQNMHLQNLVNYTV